MAYLTKNHFAEQILRRIAEYDIPRSLELDPREVMLRMDQVCNRMAKDNFLQNMRLDQSYVSPLFLTIFHGIAVEQDNEAILSFITLPAIPVNLPEERGVNKIWKGQGLAGSDFVRVNPSATSNLLGYNLEGKTGWWVQSNRVYFRKPVTGSVNISLVLADSSSISDSAPYPIGADMQEAFINEVVLFFTSSQTATQPAAA